MTGSKHVGRVGSQACRPVASMLEGRQQTRKFIRGLAAKWTGGPKQGLACQGTVLRVLTK